MQRTDDDLKTVKLTIPACEERGTVARPTPLVFNWLDVADYLRLRGTREQAKEAVRSIRKQGLLSGFRAGNEVVHTFDAVLQCIEALKEGKPA